MSAAIDISGNTYGRLTVIAREPKGRWLCICSCGQETIVLKAHLVHGRTRSCGCLKQENSTKHGMLSLPEYAAWRAMKWRCYGSAPGHQRYRDEGITVSEMWAEDFNQFYTDMGPKPTPSHSLDRIDNDGNYEPGNCRWATPSEQMRNTSRNRRVIRSDGAVFDSIGEAAEKVGCPRSSIVSVCKGRKKTTCGYGWQYFEHKTADARRRDRIRKATHEGLLRAVAAAGETEAWKDQDDG